MKITKRQLKRIIREEKAKLIAENRLRHQIRRNLREGTFHPAGGDPAAAAHGILAATAAEELSPEDPYLMQLAQMDARQLEAEVGEYGAEYGVDARSLTAFAALPGRQKLQLLQSKLGWV